MVARSAQRADSEFLLSVRNDPESVKWSKTKKAVASGEHREWFLQTLSNPNIQIICLEIRGEYHNRLAGYARFRDLGDGISEISFAIDPKYRGKKLALPGLKAALNLFHQTNNTSNMQVIAEISPGNHRSVRLFEKAGFRCLGQSGGFLVLVLQQR